jgi:UDP-N-acetylglucosamine 2-epimerase
MKVSVVLGTRPEIIKLSHVIRELERLKLDYSLVHTGRALDFEEKV